MSDGDNIRGVVILDRDGVLNEMVVDAEHGTVDSPLHPSQVKMIPRAAEAVARINRLGYLTAIATNQPSAAKGKTTQANLEAVQGEVIRLIESAGGTVINSQICFHKAEDGCECRKPKPGMLLEILRPFPQSIKASSWMVGDGITDVEAGNLAGLLTAFVGSKHCSNCRIMASSPSTLKCSSLSDFAAELERTAAK